MEDTQKKRFFFKVGPQRGEGGRRKSYNTFLFVNQGGGIKYFPCHRDICPLFYIMINYYSTTVCLGDLCLPKKVCIKEKSHGCNCTAAGPESLEHYFQKGALLGQKASLNLGTLIPGKIRNHFSRAFEGLSYLAYKITKKTYV